MQKVTIDVEAAFDYKFIVQRVDKEADEQRQQLIEELKFAINEKQRQQALANVKKALGIKKGGKLSQAIEVLRKNLV